MKHLQDIVSESLLDDEDEVAGRFEQVAKEPHIALHRDCDNFLDVAKVLCNFFGVDAKIKKGDILAKWPWPSLRNAKFPGARCIKFDQYGANWKTKTFKFILWKDQLIFNMIEWVPDRTDPKTGKVSVKGYPRILIGDDVKTKYEWGTSLWEWLSKDPRIVDALKSVVR